MIDYADFVSRLNAKVKSDEDFYVELLKTVIKSPHRYTGIFRLTNAKTKLIQNVTQSREIKFGDFMEEIVTEYIALMGYHNLDKNIGNDDAGNALSADQVFKKGNGIYLIEQKIRDDHDSVSVKPPRGLNCGSGHETISQNLKYLSCSPREVFSKGGI